MREYADRQTLARLAWHLIIGGKLADAAGVEQTAVSTNAPERRALANVFPPLEWLPVYDPAWLPSDILAGMTLAAYAIPVSLAYATLAGVPPHYGIYCYLVGAIGYA